MAFRFSDRDRGWNGILRGVRQTRDAAVRVGILDDRAHPKSKDGKSIAELAAINEYGSSDGVVPSRPAWRNAFDGGRDQIVEALERTALSVMEGRPGSVRVAMARVGLLVQKLIRESIDRLTEPPNAPSWIRRKGNDKPLEWTSTTRDAVRYEIVDAEEGR